MATEDDRLARTRASLHRVAEHILSPARYAVTGRIGLRPAPGGLRTPPFGPDERVVEVDGSDLVVRDARTERRAPLTTLRAAGAFVGIEPGAPSNVYSPATPCDLDEPLSLDEGAMKTLADWYAVGAGALEALSSTLRDEEPTEPQLWPEHLDLAIGSGGVNYGVSPGDDAIDRPYIYVGPHAGPPTTDDYWNAPFGAARTIAVIPSTGEALAFFLEGHRRLTANATEEES